MNLPQKNKSPYFLENRPAQILQMGLLKGKIGRKINIQILVKTMKWNIIFFCFFMILACADTTSYHRVKLSPEDQQLASDKTECKAMAAQASSKYDNINKWLKYMESNSVFTECMKGKGWEADKPPNQIENPE